MPSSEPTAAKGLTDEQVRQVDAAIGEHLGESPAATRLEYQTGWRAWVIDRLLTVAVSATRAASRLDRHQEHGVWERNRS